MQELNSPIQDSEFTALVSSAATASGTQVLTPTNFEFVNSNDKSTIRSHAMRASWRQRAIGSSSRARSRAIAARSQAQSPKSIDVAQNAQDPDDGSPEEVDVEVENDEETTETSSFPEDTIYLDHRHTLLRPARTSSARRKWKLSTRRGSRGQKPTLYKSIGDAEIDPFNTIRLSHEDQTLLHHCKPVRNIIQQA